MHSDCCIARSEGATNVEDIKLVEIFCDIVVDGIGSARSRVYGAVELAGELRWEGNIKSGTIIEEQELLNVWSILKNTGWWIVYGGGIGKGHRTNIVPVIGSSNSETTLSLVDRNDSKLLFMDRDERGIAAAIQLELREATVVGPAWSPERVTDVLHVCTLKRLAAVEEPLILNSQGLWYPR